MIPTFDTLLFDRLRVDAPLVALCPGGVYLASALSYKGVTRDTLPAAFDTSGRLKPMLTVRGRDTLSRPLSPYDPEEQYSIGVQVVEIFIQADNTVRAVSLDPAVSRVYDLLHERPGERLARLVWQRCWTPYADAGMAHATTQRLEFLVEGEL